MQYVYCVFGLGLGNNEDAWELCSVHGTRAGAEAAMAETLNDIPELELYIEQMPLQK